MSVKKLVKRWENHAHGTLSKNSYSVHLTVEDAAKVDALSEMYPRRSKEQLISELFSAALEELECSFPYIQGSEVITTDEEGDPIYSDEGHTPQFIDLTKKHLSKYKAANGD